MVRTSLPTFTVAAMLLIFCTMTVIPASATQNATDSKMAAQYNDRLVALSNAYCGQELKFDAAANLVSTPVWGDWKTCQGMRIRSVLVEGDKIKIAAQRVPITYDCGSGEVREVSEGAAKTEKSQHRFAIRMFPSKCSSVRIPMTRQLWNS